MYTKRIKAAASAVILSLLTQIMAITAVYAAEQCLIANPQSAGTTTGWSAWRYTNCTGYATLDDDVKYSGTSSLKLTNPTPYGANLYMQVRTVTKQLKKGKTYRYGAMIKAEQASSVTIRELNESGSSLIPIKNTYDWQKFEVNYSPTTDKTLEICFQCEDATKALWIDDVFCYEYEDGQKIGENLVANPNFDGKVEETTVQKPEGDDKNDEENEVINVSDQIMLMQEKYEKVKASEEFPAEDIKEIMGNFKYIPLYYQKGITIDGDISEWDNAVKVALPTNSQQYHIYRKGDPTDVMGNFRMLHDEEYLYIAVEVIDDINVARNDGNCWQGDSIQMAIGSETDSYGVEINMVRDPDTGVGGVYSTALDKFDLDAIKMVPSLDGKKLTYEMAIPWRIRYSEVPSSVMFDILINDNDGAGRAYVVELAPGIAENKSNAEFPKVEPLSGENDWYAWIEGDRRIVAEEATPYDFYLVNEGEEREFTISAPDGTTETVTVGKGRAVHRVYDVTVNDFGSAKILGTVSCQSKTKETYINVEVEASLETYQGMRQDIIGYIEELEGLINKCTDIGINPEYEKLRLNIMKLYPDYMTQDIEKRFFQWMGYQHEILTGFYNQDKANLNSYLSGEKTPYTVPMYVTSDRETVGNVYHAQTEANGVKEIRPVFFVGYGHFNANAALVKSLGCNTMTFGDSFPHMIQYDSNKKPFLNLGNNNFNRNEQGYLFPGLEANNVRLEYLFGAEKLMNRIVTAFPETKTQHSQNYYSEVFREKVKDTIDMWFEPYVASIGNNLGSVIIANEPTYNTNEKSHELQPYWAAYLAEHYKGDINYFNEINGTDYKQFLDVERPADVSPTPVYYDWQAFNKKYVADYYGYLSDLINEVNPAIETHVKMRPTAAAHDSTKNMFLDYGADVEDITAVTDVNGCDAHTYYNNSSWGEYEQEMMYDMLRGIGNGPVYNTEDHIIGDGNGYMGYEQADHVESALWQGAIHGRAVSNIWYWAKSYDASQLSYGMWPFRPDCVEAVGRVTYDLNRLSWEVADFANKKARVAVLYSVASRVYDKPHMSALYTAYKALLENGEVVKYVGDTTTHEIMDYDVFILPCTKHVPADSFEDIYEFVKSGKKLVILGDDVIGYDEHNQPHDAEKLSFIRNNAMILEFDEYESWILSGDSQEKVSNCVVEVIEDIGSSLVLVDAKTGERTKGIEYTSIERDGRIIINLCSFKAWGEDAEVKIIYNGKEIGKSYDLRTGTNYGSTVNVQTKIPLLLELNAGSGEELLPFDDISEHWGKANIMKLYSKGMVNGMGDRIFAPDNNVTVAEFITMTENAFGIEKAEYTSDISDVSADDWFASAVQAAVDCGLAENLISDGKITPNRPITREEMCDVVVRAYEYANKTELETEELKFSDSAAIGEAFLPSVAKAAKNNIVNGMGNNTFAPDKNATRAEAVTIICNVK